MTEQHPKPPPLPTPVVIPGDNEYDTFEAQYEPLSPTSSVATGEMGNVNWGSIDFEDLLYTDEALQDIVASFRAAVVAALKAKDFGEAHAKAEEMARFLRDYIRRCMGAEHVCCDAEDYEQAAQIAKGIKFATQLKKETGEKGGLAFGAVRRIQELLQKHNRIIEMTRIEMKKAGDAREYTKAISLQHQLDTTKADYALKLCSHLDRILEMGNLRALWTACQSIDEACPELQPDITQSGDAENMDGLVACPPAALQRPRPEKQLVGTKPLSGSVVVKHKTHLEQSKIDDMAKRLSTPKRSAADKASKETDLMEQRKGQFMLQEEYDNCTFRPTTKYKMDVITKTAIKKPPGKFYPTNAYPQRKPSPHGKARYEGETNCDPSGEEQERSCLFYVASSLQPSIWSQSDQPDPRRVSKDQLERLIRIALDDQQQVDAWGLTEGEVALLRKLRGKQQLFQLTDDLRAKAFLERITNQLSSRSTKEARDKEKLQVERQAAEGRVTRVRNIKQSSYKQLVQGIDTPGRSKRRAQMDALMKPPSAPKASLEECKVLVAQLLGCREEEASSRLDTVLEDPQSVMSTLKADSTEVKKLEKLQGEARMRHAYTLAKRAKFISRMDSYNHKTRARQ